MIKLSYSMVAYVKGIRFMFPEDYHLTILKLNSVYAFRIYEIICADRFFQKDVNPEYRIEDLRYWLDCEEKYRKTNDFFKYVIEIAIREINRCSDTIISASFIKSGRNFSKVRFELSPGVEGPNLDSV